MSELQDWKLKAQAVVKLCSKKCDKSVSLSSLQASSDREYPTCLQRHLSNIFL